MFHRLALRHRSVLLALLTLVVVLVMGFAFHYLYKINEERPIKYSQQGASTTPPILSTSTAESIATSTEPKATSSILTSIKNLITPFKPKPQPEQPLVQQPEPPKPA